MERKRLSTQFWIALIIVVITVLAAIAVYSRVFRPNFLIGPFRISHWYAWAGTLFIASFTVPYSVLKRRKPTRLKPLLMIHVFGNLISVMLITLHLAHQISRPSQTFPDLGTGVILYGAMFTLVLTGFVMRFRFAGNLLGWRFVHRTLTAVFYIVIAVHVLHGLGVI